SKVGMIYFGATRPGVLEGLDQLAKDGLVLNSMRLKAFPFPDEVKAFCDAHDKIFVVEQNRDAQMRTLLTVEAGIPAEKLIATLSYDGMPLTANFVHKAVQKHLAPAKAEAAE
ncbi:MAG: 2-oxoacid:acceptor oxidoreductase subunit alpha, partial [Hyphomicrobiaceae bacterium]